MTKLYGAPGYDETALFYCPGALQQGCFYHFSQVICEYTATKFVCHDCNQIRLGLLHWMVILRQKVTYSNVLKFLITLGSVSAVAPSSPILVHLYLFQSRLNKKYIRRKDHTQIHIVCVITLLCSMKNTQHPTPTFQLYLVLIQRIQRQPDPTSTDRSIQSINQFTTHFSTSSDLLCCNALARVNTPVAVRSLSLRLQWSIIRHEQTAVARSMSLLLWQ